MPRVLSIDVPMALLEDWAGWFVPDPQPFVVDAALASMIGAPVGGAPLTPELRDTFGLYPSQSRSALAWWGEREFRALPRPHRAALVRAQRALGREVVSSVRSWEPLLGNGLRGQADGYRFVWWRSLLRGHEQQVLTDFVEDGRRPSRHAEVPAEVWTAAAAVLPAAQRLAGTFPPGSGPNCFGAVMGAAGVPRAEREWMQREPFERWLTDRTPPGGSDDDAGTVLVWRSPDGLVQHAAVTLGAGWALHKPSQGWMSPTKVLAVAECKASSRVTGRRLHRRTLVPRVAVTRPGTAAP